ncbi:hypothetical protein OZX61_12445 (plasmid) [Acinetobacter sp. ESL0695]|uniref:hypothetical protein n=1 Tax=Acinetobacter sp. ESL0695 TaxID=2983215 RepID=UPI0023EFA1A4|nr:hypothetical protein [Acinetobacter sp. ESL0695]WEV50137.1 hypothetical protein OZX61_12445 [Acinetobacter sp. ESL0695]
MPNSKMLLAIKLTRMLGTILFIFILSLVFLNLKTFGINKISIKYCGPFFWLGLFYFLLTTIYLKDLRSKLPEIKLDRDVRIGTILSITFAVLMMFSISLKNI